MNDHRPTSERFTDHFGELVNSKIMGREEGPGQLRWINGYFSTPKDEKVDRAILNAKVSSKLFAVPDPVNLQPGRLILPSADIAHGVVVVSAGTSVHRLDTPSMA